jgi:hypothetical protein
MDITTKPATDLSVNLWTSFNLSQRIDIKDGQLVPVVCNTLTKETLGFIGDADGKPTMIKPNPGMMGTARSWPMDLSETVTRADGSKWTVQDLLCDIAQTAQPPAPL